MVDVPLIVRNSSKATNQPHFEGVEESSVFAGTAGTVTGVELAVVLGETLGAAALDDGTLADALGAGLLFDTAGVTGGAVVLTGVDAAGATEAGAAGGAVGGVAGVGPAALPKAPPGVEAAGAAGGVTGAGERGG
ncbi:MAG: hypothetical protein U0670_03355 [Anaerolineae bacterium]